MKAQFIRFGEVEIDGTRYREDVVVNGGVVGERDKAASRSHKSKYGHTPLSIDEPVPWNCSRLIVGTGANGRLPITPEVKAAAEKRGVELIAVPKEQACTMLSEADTGTTNAILHLTC